MEGDRNAFAEETNVKLSKQRSLIAALKRDKQNLVTELRLAASASNKRKDAKMTVECDKLIERHDSHDQAIKKETLHLEEIEEQIRKVSVGTPLLEIVQVTRILKRV